MPVDVSGDSGSVYIDEIVVDGANGFQDNNNNMGRQQQQRNGGVGDVGGGGAGAKLRNQLLSIQSSLLSLRREIVDFKAHHGGFVTATERSFAVVNGNIRRVAIQPVP